MANFLLQTNLKADEQLDYERQNGNYIFRTDQVAAIAAILEKVSAHNWALVDLSMKESALEEIYVRLMTKR